MQFRIHILFIVLFIAMIKLNAQDIRIYNLWSIENEQKKNIAFVPLSDAIDFNVKLDSATIEKFGKNDSLVSRRIFLFKRRILETDKIFIYNYSTKVLKTLKVKDMPIIFYDDDYGIGTSGFEISKKLIIGMGEYDNNVFVSFGQQNPFAQERLTKVVWKMIESNDFPSSAISLKDNYYFEENEYGSGAAYTFETQNLRYYVQDLIQKKTDWHFGKRLIVLDTKTDRKLYETIYYAGESASFALPSEQWTGKLFKDLPVVILGFQSHAFGCPSITVLDSTKNEIPIFCNNNH